MLNLFEMFARAQGGAAMDMLSRQFRLSPQQTEAAVEALLPAFIIGLQRMASTPDGLYKLANLMAQSTYQSLFNRPAGTLDESGEQAGNAALSAIFGPPEMTRAIADQAAQFAGIGSAAMQRMLPLMTAMLLGGMSQFMRPGPAGLARAIDEATASRPAQDARAAGKPQPNAETTSASPQDPASARGGPAPGQERPAPAAKKPPEMGGELFTQMFEAGRNIQQAQFDTMRRIFDAFLTKPDRPR